VIVNEALRTLFLTRLLEAISVIAPGPRFEQFGGKFLSYLIGIPLNNRGLNVLGNPVGHVVDTVSDLGDIAAEYTIEKRYFDGRMTKAWGDLRHARQAYPDSKEVFLVCTETAPPSKFDLIMRTAGRCHRRHGVQVRLYDGRRIAETIVDRFLTNDSAIEVLSDFLPSLRHIRDEHEASLLLPDLDQDYVSRRDVESAIEEALDARHCLTVSGIGGSGKSQVAAAVARAGRDSYDLVIWYDAREIMGIGQLQSLPIARSGIHRNVSTLLRTQRCLLVLDDLQIDLDERTLVELCGPGSHILITKRTSRAGTYNLPALDSATAKAVLTRDIPDRCPDQVFELVWNTVGGHPLTLRLMNAAVRGAGASWRDIEEDCEFVGEILDARQERVADRVLRRLMSTVGRELSLFAWAEQSTCDRGFARRALGPVGLRKLSQHCLTSADAGNAIRMHDIVFNCLRAANLLSSDRNRELTDLLDQYVAEVYDSDLEFIALCNGLRRKMDALVRAGERRPTFLYCLLLASDAAQLDQSVTGDIEQYIRELAAAGNPGEIAVGVALEMIESSYRHRKTSLGIDVAKAGLAGDLALFDKLAMVPGLMPRSAAEIMHHRAKALNLTGERSKAIDAFESVLAGPFPLDAARLQLVRIYGRDPATSERAAVLASEILDRAIRHPDEVATSVVLAAVEAVPWTTLRTRKAELSAKYGDVIEQRIVAAALAGADQPYQTFASIGRYWAWNEHNRFMRVWAAMPRRSIQEVTRDQDRFAYGDILRQAAQSTTLAQDQRVELQNEALTAFDAIQHPAPYHVRTKGALLVDMGRHADAERLLMTIEDSKQEPWRSYWLSKARFGLGKPEALADIENALGKIDKGSPFWSTFKAHRFEVRRASGAADAVEDLREAIETCHDERHKALLEERLAQYEQKV
jgi:hypothetical protein